MEPKKNRQVSQERNISTNFIIGFCIALSFVLIGFEWTTDHSDRAAIDRATGISPDIDMIKVIPREEKRPEPEKPKLPLIAEIIIAEEEDPDLAELIFDPEVTPDTWINIWVNQDDGKEDLPKEPVYIVEIMPTFNGGNPSIEFSKYIAAHLKYPEEAAANGIEGRVVVIFVIDKKGNLVDIEIYKGVHPALDKEALRVVANSPPWEPGIQSGIIVPVRYIFPINYVLH